MWVIGNVLILELSNEFIGVYYIMLYNLHTYLFFILKDKKC